jgi:heptosyltransferase-3
MAERSLQFGNSTSVPAALRDAVDFSAIRRVLVVKLRFHGDVLLATPVFSALKRRHPHLEIDALIYHETRDMLAFHPDIAQIHCIDRGWKQLGFVGHMRAEIALMRQLRARRYDLLIHLTEHWRGPILKRVLGIRIAVAERYARREPSRLWQRSFTHHYAKPKMPRHKVERHLDALRRIGVYPEPEARALRLVPGREAQESAGAKLDQLGLRNGSFILIHPTSRFLHKCWTVEGMAQLIDRLQPQLPVLLTAAPAAAELEVVDAIRARTRTQPASLAGQLNLKELAYCIGAARLAVGVDSAPMHMAAAMQTPVVALFGPTSQEVWGPWQVPNRIVATHPSCQPCHLRGCGEGHVSDCLLAIDVDSVFRACQDLLALG